MLRLWVLGSWRAELDEHPIPRLPTRHARALLARLALAHPRPLARSELHHALFPNATPDHAASSLRTTLFYVRRALRTVIRSDDTSIALDPSLVVDLDVIHFEHASAPGATQTMLETAVELYRGPFLQFLKGEGWAHDEAERVQRQYVDALQRLLALSDASGDHRTMLNAALCWTHEEPWNEEAVLALAKAYVAGGDRRNAQTQLKVARTLLDRNGAAPFRAMLEQLSRATALLPDRQSEERFNAAKQRLPTIDFRRSALVGRAEELGQLKRLWEAARGGTAQVLTLEGDPGVGKSRLLHELVEHVRSSSNNLALVGRGNIHTNDHALGMLRTAFTAIPASYHVTLNTAAMGISEQAWNVVSQYPEFHVLAPERGVGDLVRLDAASEVARRRAAILELLDGIMARRPLLLVLEDAYPGDPETRHVLDALMHATQRVLVVRTRRTGDSTGEDRELVLRLTPLAKDSMRALVNTALDAPSVPATLDRIVAWSEGNPLWARELIRALILGEHLRQDAHSRWAISPHTTEKPDLSAALPFHHGLLSREAHELVHLLAVLGRPADAQMLVRLLPGDKLQHARTELLAHHILIEYQQGLMFEHDSWRDTILARLDASEKQMLHGRIATALRSISPNDPAERMIHEANAHEWEHAWTVALAAAKQAWAEHQLGVMRQALQIAEQALGELEPASSDERRWELLSSKEQYAASADRGIQWAQALEELQRFAEAHTCASWRVEALVRSGRALREQGRLPEAEPVLRDAAEQARKADLDVAEARARTSLAAVLEDRGMVIEAVHEQQAAVEAARRSDDPVLKVHALGVLAYMQMRAGQIVKALSLNTHVLEAPEVQRQPVLRARFARHQGVIMLADRRYEEGLGWLRHSVAHGQQIGDLFGLLTSQTSLVYYQALLGLHAECSSLGEVLVPQVRKDQARTHLCWLLYALARASYAQGDGATAETLARESAALGEAVGDFDIAAGSFALMAQVASEEQRSSEAMALMKLALRCAARVDRPTLIINHIAAAVCLAVDEPVRARSYAYQALQQAREPGLASVFAVEALHDVANVLARVEVPSIAEDVRGEAYRLLLSDVARIALPALRRAYINANPAHRALASSNGSGTQRLALLPTRTAPRGRPLHPDEYVPTVWTIRDEDTAASTDHRRGQIQRLIDEAAEQGAMATVEALARALVVAPRTIQRDLQALRRQGLQIDTRGTH